MSEAFLLTIITFWLLPDVDLSNMQAVCATIVIYIAWLYFVDYLKLKIKRRSKINKKNH